MPKTLTKKSPVILDDPGR
jgi:hypothetical protein